MFGVLCVLPYVVRLQRDTLQAAIEQTGLSLPMLLALSVAQAAVVLAIAVAIGAWASRRVGLGAPLLDALLQGGTLPPGTKRVLAQAVGLGVACAGGIIALGSDSVGQNGNPGYKESRLTTIMIHASIELD